MSKIFKKSDEELKNEFYNLISRKDVAELLEIKEKSLRYFLYVKNNEDLYTTFEIPKKKEGVRKISAPVKELKSIQRKLAYVLNLVYKVKPSAYGFISKKNIKDNAKKHIRKKIILNLDLENFFNQVHFGRVRGMLIHKPYSIGQEAATVIAQLACFNGVLSQGSPSSPVITNMICSPLDTQLIRLAKKYGVVYTRYVDDITLSTFNDSFSESIVKGDVSSLIIGSELENILKKNSFRVNSKKVFLNSSFTRQEVTGLIVNRFPNVKREYIKNLRAILHNCFKNGIYETALEYIDKGYCKKKYITENSDNVECVNNWFRCVLKGKINFIREIKGQDDYIFLKYAQQLNRLFNEEIFDLDFLDEFIYNVVVLESMSKNDIVQGSGFFVKNMGLFTNYHVTQDSGVYSVKTYKMEQLGTVCKEWNEINSNRVIDYALYKLENSKMSGLELGDSKNIKIGDKIVVIGYPEYCDNDSPNIQTCNIISRTKSFGECLYTISGRIVHGSSGGVVLDMNHKVIGIIKAGVATLNEEDTSSKQGFIPIHLVLEHLSKSV